jgi:Tfp pilus assembly protein PilX
MAMSARAHQARVGGGGTVSQRTLAASPPRSQGASLVVVLVLLGALALGTVAALRASAGSTRLGHAQLMRTLALEQAQAGLRYCESQLLLPMSSRLPAWADASLPLTVATRTAWASSASWQTGPLRTADVPPAAALAKPPVCLVERQVLADQPRGLPIYLVTVRGFSPDHQADASTGLTQAGAVAWLQSTLLIEDGQMRARTFRCILNPPLR